MEQRKGLGRGLASLIRAPTEASKAEKVKKKVVLAFEQGSTPQTETTVSITRIKQNPNQPRKKFTESALKELADSISEKGVISPLLVKKEGAGFLLIAGERRFRASKMVGLKDVPIIIRESSEAEVMELALIENIQREDLNPLEEAAGYQELINRFDYTQENVAKKVGKDRATVANLLRLLKLPEKVKNYLRDGKITMGHARTLVTVPLVDRQLYFCEKVVIDAWSVRELEAAISVVRKVAGAKTKRPSKELPPGLSSLMDTMRNRLGTQVQLIPSGRKGKIVIEYYSQDDLNRLYNLIVTGQTIG
jgi:ParB family transcriptional regulator, chromosome partitioning protein